MPYDDPGSRHIPDDIDSILDHTLALTTMDRLRRAFRESLGEQYQTAVVERQNSIAADTSFDGFACHQRYFILADRVVSETTFRGSHEEQLFVGSYLMAMLDERMAKWPSDAAFRGEWIKRGVHAELLGGTAPEDPLRLLITYGERLLPMPAVTAAEGP